MKTTVEVMLVIFLLVFNVLLGGFLLFNIQIFSSPEITIHLNVKEVTDDALSFQTILYVNNENPAAIILEDITITGKTSKGTTIIETQFKGGTVPAYGNSSFTVSDNITFDEKLDTLIEAEIAGTVGIRLFGVIDKTLPLKATVIASLEDLISSIHPPKIDLEANIIDVTQEGVELEARVIVENPNSFDLVLRNLTTLVTTDIHDQVATLSSIDGVIEKNEITHFTLQGVLPYLVFNASLISLNAIGEIGANIVGLRETIPIELDATLVVPDLAELLFNDETMDFSVSAEFKLRLRGLVTTVGFLVYNPSNIPLETRDLRCKILGLTGEDQYKVIVKEPMENCEIPTDEEICVTSEVILPYIKVLTSGTNRLLPTWFVLRIEGNLTIADTGQYIPISINGYVDPHLIK